MQVASLDFRTRFDDDVPTFDVVEFFDNRLPALAADHGDLAVPGVLELEVQTFTVDTPVGAWTLKVADGNVRITPGSGGDAIVRLDAEDVIDIVNDQRTPMTFLTAGTLDMPRGNLGDFLDWWVILRSLVDGRAIHTAGAIDFHDERGDPLDLHRSFPADGNPAEAAHFLAEAGFLHLTGVFTKEEMAQVSTEMDAALPQYVPDDGRSWWARTNSGEHRPVRLQWFHEHSPTTTALLGDDRFLRIGRLTTDGHVARAGGNYVEALVKPIGVVEGISDVPWHKDCSLGRHSYSCCGLTVGISVTGADERSGQLAVVAGSHRALVQPTFVRRSWQLPEVSLPTLTGDVTVHSSCTLHMSYPPIDSERRVMYTGFLLPARAGGGDRRSYDPLARIREQAYKTVSQTPGHIA